MADVGVEISVTVDKKRKNRADSQKRYIKLKRDTELRHRYIVIITGHNPQTGTSRSDVRMLPTEQFLRLLIENLSYDSICELRKIEQKLNSERHNLDCTTLQIGAAARVPIPPMVNVFTRLERREKDY
jgi:hypothetical protein